MNHSENTARVRRITEMEARLDRISQALQAVGLCPARLEAFREDAKILSDYYESSLWQEDFEADEAGLLPQDLKRGVLSEDAVYDLLNDFAEWKERLQEPVQKHE